MESLTKTQIVLLVLLVSFVTSLATGIVTVTLVNQAPQPVTHTINKVVEKLVPREFTVKEKTVVFSNEEKSCENNKKRILGGGQHYCDNDGEFNGDNDRGKVYCGRFRIFRFQRRDYFDKQAYS